MLKIKQGVELRPFGELGKTFTSESELDQDVLEFLKGKYPDEVEETEPKKPKAKEPKA